MIPPCCSVTDLLSHFFLRQQNNLSNPPTPPASLPPTPPPLPRQKLLNGFASTDELSRKDVQTEQEGACGSVDHQGSDLSSSWSIAIQGNPPFLAPQV